MIDDTKIVYEVGKEIISLISEKTSLTETDVLGTIADMGYAQVETMQEKNKSYGYFNSTRRVKFPNTTLLLKFQMKANVHSANIKVTFCNKNFMKFNRHEIQQRIIEANLLGVEHEKLT